MIRILIVDDHAIVRSGLKQILEENQEMKVAAECDNGVSALDWLRSNDCDIVLLDISMPGMSGIDVLKQLKDEKPKLPVLIISIYPEDQYAVRLMRAGAAGYLTKESAPAVLVEAVRRVASGKKHINAAIAEMLANEFGESDKRLPHETLSDREFQIFLLFAAAETTTEIAIALGLSVKTISTYRSRILEKLHLNNNSELIRYAFEKHLIV